MIKDYLKSKIGDKIIVKLITNSNESGCILKINIINVTDNKIHLFINIGSFTPSGYIKSGSEHSIGDLFIEYNKIETINDFIDKIIDTLEINYINKIINL